MPFGITNLISEILASSLAVKKSRLEGQIKELSKLISQNSNLANKIMDAYQDKNMNLINSIISSSPFGASFKHLKQVSKKLKNDKDDQINKLNEDRVNLEGALNQANSTLNNINGGIADKISAFSDKKQKEHINETINNSKNQISNIEGGLTKPPESNLNRGIQSIRVK